MGTHKKFTITLNDSFLEKTDIRKNANEGNRSEQIAADLSEYWQLLEHGLGDARRVLTRNQVKLILDALNGTFLNFTYGRQLRMMIFSQPSMLHHEICDHIDLNNAATTWNVDAEKTKIAVESLSPISVLAMIDFVRQFWGQPEPDLEKAVEIFMED